MTYISNRHRAISDRERNLEILSDPEKYFGPNYKILLNAWIYVETLPSNWSEKYQLQWEALPEHIHSFQRQNTRDRSRFLILGVGSSYWELEIINVDIILESGRQLYSVPLLTHSEVATRRDVWRF